MSIRPSLSTVPAALGRLLVGTAPAVAALWAVATAAQAQEMPVYYDFVENGELRGGKIVLDRRNPEHRRTFGLDLPDGFLRAVWPATTIIDNGPTSNRIDLVMLGDGYTQSEIASYAAHVNTVITDFLSEGVIAEYASYFNVHRVDVTSNESGVDEINLGIFRDTTLDMAYGCFAIDRLLCINVSKALAAAASAPETDQILALANSTRYGGAGYPADDLGTLAGNNSSSVEVALHEFGHSFADLADEYDYADGATYTDPEPIEPNVSIFDAGTQTTQQLKWYRWMDLAFVDTFEGAMYHQFGIYRPTSGSKMRFLGQPYQSINDEQFVFNIYQIVSPIDDVTPPSASPLSACTQFFVVPMQPTTHTLDVQWYIDGIEVPGATATTFTPDPASLQPGTHQVRVEVTDNTTLVRDETRRATLMTEARQWEIDVSTISEESNAAGNCADQIDNDCDGLTDEPDPDCIIDCPFTDDFERAASNTVGNGWGEVGGNPGATAIEFDGTDTYCLMERNNVSITQSLIDTTGLVSVTFAYEWRDNGATDAGDSLIVEWKPSADGTFITLATHVLTQVSFLTETHALPASAENTSIDIRFVTAVSSNAKGAHVDNVAVCGTEPCPDGDGDGVCDLDDICPGFDDSLDTDGDGAPDGCDGCPIDPNKTDPGQCGCGVSDDDTDGDGALDCCECEGCPGDPNKIDPGICGCGTPDTDTDGDGIADCIDECPNDPDVSFTTEETHAAGNCGDGIDNDCDGLTDGADAECATPGCPLACGDIDGSGGNVTLVDFATFALCFNRNNPGGSCPDPGTFACADLDGNGTTNLVDFATFSLVFGKTSTNAPPNCP